MPFTKQGGYSPAEHVNQGPHGAGKGKVTPGHGQSSDGGGHNDLVPQNPMQHDPYRARGTDWPVRDVDAFDKQSGPAGHATGKDELAKLSDHQEGPRHIEDGGPETGSGTPTDWHSGGRSAKVAAAFPITRGQGESNSGGGEVSIAESVNLQTGHIEGGSAQTRVKEVPQHDVHIPSR